MLSMYEHIPSNGNAKCYLFFFFLSRILIFNDETFEMGKMEDLSKNLQNVVIGNVFDGF